MKWGFERLDFDASDEGTEELTYFSVFDESGFDVPEEVGFLSSTMMAKGWKIAARESRVPLQ